MATGLPKRFREKPRQQDVYSKRDWEKHASHAPPFGFGPTPSQYDGVSFKALSDAEGGRDDARKANAFIGVPMRLFPHSPALGPLCTPVRCDGRFPAANSCPASLNGPCFTLPARGRLRGADASAVCLQARAAGGDKGDTSDSGSSRGSGGARGFGKPHGKAVESGFSKAKKERPNEYPQMQAVFTCGRCDVRQSKVFTRMAYEQGVVVVKCNGCGVQHIMANNLGYFKDMTGKRAVNVEDLLLAKGERVDNRLSEAGVGELKLADATEREDGTIEVRPEAP